MTDSAVDTSTRRGRGARLGRGLVTRATVGALRSWRGRIGLALALLVLGLAFAGPFVAPPVRH